MSVAVVGAGISGLACARVLMDGGVQVVVHERSRAVGGRMASPLLHGRRVDTGAAYFTVDGDGFDAQVQDWRRRDLAQPWTDTLGVWSGGERSTKSGPQRWCAPGGLRSLVEDLATGLDVRLGSEVHSVRRGVGGGVVLGGSGADGGEHDAVVLAMPDPQALRLLDATHTAARAELMGREWEPVIAVAIGAHERTWGELTAMFVNDHPVLALLADDGARRGDGAPVLLAHTTSPLAAAHLDDPAAVVPAVLAALPEVLGSELDVAWTHPHRWGMARPAQNREATHWWGGKVGLCGDGWGRSKVGTAWDSGTALGTAILATG
ncbi:MAG: FAD-dependent oxidoreductase [Mycobacteriaceae bacterium]